MSVFEKNMMTRDANSFFNDLWGLRPDATHNPSPNPTTLLKSDLTTWTSPKHVVAEKTDGERAALLFARTEDSDVPYIALIHRNRNVTFLETKHVDSTLYDGTLLDGEWIPEQKHYRIFDTIVYRGYNKKRVGFLERLRLGKLVKDYVVPEAWSMDTKKFYELKDLKTLGHKISTGAMGKTDGLIFMPKDDSVVTGRAANIKKWKPTLENTIDLEWVHDQGWCCVGTSGQLEPYPVMLDGGVGKEGIYELKPVSVKGDSWMLYRSRPDKRFPNHITTIEKTLATIRENIVWEDLTKAFC
jgi:hypothetical protein